MIDKRINKKQLADKVKELRRRVAELEGAGIGRRQAGNGSPEPDIKYLALFESAIDAIFIIDRESEKIIDCNKKAADISGYPVRELMTMTLTELCLPEEQDIVSKIFRKVAVNRPLSGISGIHLLRKDGLRVPVEINAAARELGGMNCICGIVRDITLRKETEDLLRESQEKARAMLDTSLDAIIMMDGDGIISYFNKAAEKMFGFSQREVRRKRLHDILVSEGARKKYIQSLPRFEQSGQCRIIGKTVELIATKKDRTRFPVEISVSSFQLQGKWHSVGAVRDITYRKEMEATLRGMSLTDELTGLYNRKVFFDLSLHQMKLANRGKRGLHLLLMKVDNLKTLYVEYGQKEGDRALQDAAKLLKGTFRESDIISRTGGDTFSVLLIAPPGPDIEKTIINHFEAKIKAFRKQKSQNHALSLSIGISRFDPAAPCSLDELIVRAEAMIDKNSRLKPVIAERAVIEKRQHERISNGRTLMGEFDIGGDVFIRNISLGGICLRTSALLPSDRNCNMLLTAKFQKKIHLTGRVVWTSELHPKRKADFPAFDSGLQFIDLKNSVKKSMQTLISGFRDR